MRVCAERTVILFCWKSQCVRVPGTAAFSQGWTKKENDKRCFMIQSNPIYAFLMQMGAIQERTLLKSFFESFLICREGSFIVGFFGFWWSFFVISSRLVRKFILLTKSQALLNYGCSSVKYPLLCADSLISHVSALWFVMWNFSLKNKSSFSSKA